MTGDHLRGAGWRYFAVFVAGVALLWTGIALTLNAVHERVSERIYNDHRNLARSLAANVASSFRSIDLSLLHLRDEWVNDRRRFDAIVAREIDLLRIESIEQVSVIDAAGRLVWSNLPGWRPVDLSDRGHYKTHLAGGDRLYISEPVIGRNSQKASIRFTRPVFGPGGRFAGVIAIAVPPLALEKIYNDLRLVQGGNVSLVHSDGYFLARSENFSAAASAPLPVATTPGLRSGDPVEGGSRRINAIEKVDSIVTYRKVAGFPAVVYVREPVDLLLAGYYAQRFAIIAGGLLVTALTLWLTLLIRAKSDDRKSGELSRARLAALVDGANDAIISHDAEGRIATWNSGAEKMFGYTAAEAIGTYGLITSVESRLRLAERRERIRNGRTVPDEVAERITRDGRRILVSIRISPVKNDAGEYIGSSIVCRDISERRRAEEAQARLAAIVEHANDAIIGRTLDGKVTSWNAAAERLFGYSAAEVIGTHGVLTPAELQPETRRNREVLATGKPIPPYETVRLAKGGRRIDVSFSASPICDERGLVIGMANILRDISERKRADEARARLAAIIESANDAIIGRTTDGHVTSWNAAAQRMFGYTIDEINGRADLLTPVDKLDESQRNRQLIKSGQDIPAYETVHVTRDGRRIDVLLSGSPVRNERGEIIGMANILRDITERKSLENALHFLAAHNVRSEGQEFFKPLTEYLAVALKAEYVSVARFEGDGALVRTLAVHVHGAFQENFSYALAGTPCGEVARSGRLFCREGVAARFPLFSKLREFGAEGYAGIILRGENGRPIGIVAAMARLPLADPAMAESILKLVAVRAEGELERDFVMGALRQSEAQLARLNSELEANVERRTADLRVINEELESFSYSVAHDLRAPLRAIGGFSAMVLGKTAGVLDSASVGHLQRIKTNAERMAELIDDLLNLTRVSRQQLHRIEFDFTAVAQSAADALAEAAPQREVAVSIQPGMRVNADPGLIRVLLENLIGNAWKFTAGVTPARIEVGCETRDGHYEYFVRDNGAGFDMNYAGKLFAPFQRLHGREEFEGTGIGLSIVRRVVMKHGGTVRAESQVNAGAVFYFTLG